MTGHDVMKFCADYSPMGTSVCFGFVLGYEAGFASGVMSSVLVLEQELAQPNEFATFRKYAAQNCFPEGQITNKQKILVFNDYMRRSHHSGNKLEPIWKDTNHLGPK